MEPTAWRRGMAVRRQFVGPDEGRDAPQAAGTPRLQQLYEENLAAIYRFIYSKVGNREEAEDLTSQVFVKAVRTLDHARGAQSIQSWLFQVARTTVADHWRQFYRIRVNSLDDLLESGWEGPIEGTTDLRTYAPDTRAQRLL